MKSYYSSLLPWPFCWNSLATFPHSPPWKTILLCSVNLPMVLEVVFLFQITSLCYFPANPLLLVMWLLFLMLTLVVVGSGTQERSLKTPRLVTNTGASTHRTKWAHCFLDNPGGWRLSFFLDFKLYFVSKLSRLYLKSILRSCFLWEYSFALQSDSVSESDFLLELSWPWAWFLLEPGSSCLNCAFRHFLLREKPLRYGIPVIRMLWRCPPFWDPPWFYV